MLHKFFNWLASTWAIKQELPAVVDVVMFATMSATESGLTRGSKEVMDKALEIAHFFPEAKIAYSAHAYNKTPNQEVSYKKSVLPSSAIYVGEACNTFHEAYLFWSKVQNFRPCSVVMVTDEWHSRSMAYALRKVSVGKIHPVITLVTVSGFLVLSEDNPIRALRNHWVWALSNILRHGFMVFVPFSQQIMIRLKIHQPM